MKISTFVAVVAVVACCALGFLFFHAQREASAAHAENEGLRAATNDLAGHIAELESKHVDEGELSRFQADQREAIKLRAEVANLKKAVAAADASKAAAQKAARA